MKQMMRAAVFEKPYSIQIKEVPIPKITDDEVLIKIEYTGICGTDWSIYTGKYSSDKLPLIAGHEFSGTIAQVGANAVGLAEGERVTADINNSCGHCFYCKKGLNLLCPEFNQLGIHIDGAFAEYVKAPWTLVHHIPDRMDMLKAAFVEPTSCVIHSAKALDITVGSSVAILGSGLGCLHAAAAKARGAAPIIVVGRNKHRLEIAKQLGADETISVKDYPDPVARVRELTEGRGADFTVESVGTAKTYEQALAMLRPGGTMAAFGITGEEEEMRIRPADLVLSEKKITSSCAGVGDDWNDAIALLAYERVDPAPLFSKIMPLERVEEALKMLQEDRNLTKIFISPLDGAQEKAL
ncbi:MAG: zinc-dependent alcohol dehydrogenase [Spirochaetota bacterium]